MDKYSFFMPKDCSDFKQVLRVKKGQKANDSGPGKAGDIALEIYRRNFMHGFGGDIAYAAVRIGIIIGSRKGCGAGAIIKAIDGWFTQEEKRLGQATCPSGSS